MIDIRQDHLDNVRGILKSHLPGRRVCVFGSRVTGTAKEQSDLDMVIMDGEPLSVHELGELNYAFQSSDLPFRVDVVEWGRISDEFKAVIAGQLREIWTAQASVSDSGGS